VKHGTWIAIVAAGNSAADHFDHLAARGPARLKNIEFFWAFAERRLSPSSLNADLAIERIDAWCPARALRRRLRNSSPSIRDRFARIANSLRHKIEFATHRPLPTGLPLIS
jgi:hypothetical protein